MTTAAKGRTRPRIPFMEGILPFDRARLPVEIIAGCTLAALAIPETMGYATIAGMPVITGLYTLLLPILFFAFFGSSRHLVVGADSATAAILATGLAGMGLVAGSSTYVEMASFAALIAALLLITARILRLGFIANFLSSSVLIGFLTGVGIQVAMGQVGGMFGIPSQSGTTIEKFIETIKLIPSETQVDTLVVSIAVLGTILGLRRVNEKIPGALIAVIGAIVLSYVLDLSAKGVTTIGSVPSGLPSLGLPTDVMTGSNFWTLLPIVFSIVIVILAQSAATSRAYAMKYSDKFDENVDLVGLSLGNLGAGITGTFVVNGSPTKTQMVDSAGGRNQLAQLTAGALVIVVLLFLTVPLSYMPNAVLASVVFLIGIELINYKGMYRIYKLRPGEFAVAAITAFVVVAVGVMQGILLAIILSVIEHLYHSYAPNDSLFAEGETGRVKPTPVADGAQLAPGLAAYYFGANLYYANVARFTEEIMGVVERAQPPLRWFAIIAATIGDIDLSGADALRQIHSELDTKGLTLVLVDVEPSVRKELDDYGLTPVIGATNFFDSSEELLAAYAALPPMDPPPAAPDPTAPAPGVA